jgi:hypothetical protein
VGDEILDDQWIFDGLSRPSHTSLIRLYDAQHSAF